MSPRARLKAKGTSQLLNPSNTVLASRTGASGMPGTTGGLGGGLGGGLVRVIACRYGLAGPGLVPVQRLSLWRDFVLLAAGLVLLVVPRPFAAARVGLTRHGRGWRVVTARLPVEAILLRLDALLCSAPTAGGMPTAAGTWSPPRPDPTGSVDRALVSNAGGRLLRQVPAQALMIMDASTGPDHADAAAVLGVRPDRCLAVETTASGVTAARAAGMWTIALVPPGDAAAEWESTADFAIRDLGQLRPILTSGQLIAVLVITGAEDSGGNAWTSTAS